MCVSIRCFVTLLALMLQSTVTAQTLSNVAVGDDRPWSPQPALMLSWYNGTFQNIGANTNCITSAIEIRTQAYTGFTLLPSNRTPATGEVFYAHLVISHPGNPCAGSAVGLEMLLPAGVQPAPSVGNPAFCFARVPPNSSHPNTTVLYNLAYDAGYGCPQSFPLGLEGLRISAPNGGFGGGSWGMAQGVWLEFLIPLTTSQPHNGSQQIRFRVNPDIAVVGYPGVPFLATNDVIFRTSNEDNQLSLEICTVSPIPQGCP